MNDTTLMIFLPAIKAPMKHSEDEVNIAYSGRTCDIEKNENHQGTCSCTEQIRAVDNF